MSSTRERVWFVVTFAPFVVCIFLIIWFGGRSAITIGRVLDNAVQVTEWRDAPASHGVDAACVPSRVVHLGIEYECVSVDSRIGVLDHVHDWSRTLNGVPVSGAECLGCREVAE